MDPHDALLGRTGFTLPRCYKELSRGDSMEGGCKIGANVVTKFNVVTKGGLGFRVQGFRGQGVKGVGVQSLGILVII